MQELDANEKRMVIKSYLGDLCEYFNDEEEKLFEEKLKNIELACLIKADDYKTLKKAMSYILLKLGKKVRYIYAKSNDIIDSLFEETLDDESYSFNDYQESQFLVIYHPRVWKHNKILWQTLDFLCETRTNAGKPTIIISDAYKLYDENGSLSIECIVNLSNNASMQNSAILSAFTGTSGGIYED